MRAAGRIVAETLELVGQAVRPGVETAELDTIAREHIVRSGAKPAFLGYRGFPATICASINEEVVHGIPSDRRLRDGEIISVDVGAFFNGYCGDAAMTFPVGTVSPEAKRLMDVTRASLELAVKLVKPGVRLLSVSKGIQDLVEKNGFSVVRQYVGHGIGVKMHEDPQVPNYVPPVTERIDVVLKKGIVLAIEPMVNQGKCDVMTLDNHWTVVTKDRKLSAHFEHTIAVTETGSDVLTKVDK